MELNVQLSTWENLTLAWQNASRGKRGRAATAAFELYLGDHLVQIQREAATTASTSTNPKGA
ncbi:MAG: hypothetical protein MUC85_13430 [Anaerolineales bacterium]|nr:hypothetical protein [Anaerolineales bacterium]